MYDPTKTAANAANIFKHTYIHVKVCLCVYIYIYIYICKTISKYMHIYESNESVHIKNLLREIYINTYVHTYT